MSASNDNLHIQYRIVHVGQQLVLYLALLSCSLCYVKLHVVHVLLFGQIKKSGKEGSKNLRKCCNVGTILYQSMHCISCWLLVWSMIGTVSMWNVNVKMNLYSAISPRESQLRSTVVEQRSVHLTGVGYRILGLIPTADGLTFHAGLDYRTGTVLRFSMWVRQLTR